MSSFYDDASLVVIPSGYKTSKVYAEKPTDGSGDLAFTRTGDTATRVNSAGLIERVRTNLVTYSQDFSNAAWLIGTGQTKTVSQTDPNGGTTAVLISNVSEANGYLSHALTLTANVPNTFSIYIKGSTSGSVSIRLDDSGAGPQFDINYTTSWQRFSVTRTVNQSSCFLTVGGYSTWAIGENIQFAFSQVETGDIATAYIPTTTAAVSVGPVANVPRLDYLGSTCGKLLLEPQRTNLVTFSEQLNNAAWTKDGATVTANATTAPDGTTSADKILETATTAVHNVYQVPTLSSSIYSVSFFVKKAERFKVAIADRNTGGYVAFNLNTGTIIESLLFSGVIQSFANDWYRLTITSASAVSVLNPQVFILPDSYTTGVPALITYAGNATSGIYIWGAQLEAGAYATSYIPTLAASVTRVADAASKTGISSLIGQTEGTLFAEIYPEEFINGSYLGISDGANIANRIIFGFEAGSANSGFFQVYGASGLTGSGLYTRGQRMKVAIGYKSGNSALYVNGNLVDAVTTTFTTTLTKFGFDSYAGTQNFVGRCSQALVFKTRLTNSQLAELTTL